MRILPQHLLYVIYQGLYLTSTGICEQIRASVKDFHVHGKDDHGSEKRKEYLLESAFFHQILSAKEKVSIYFERMMYRKDGI